MTQIIQTELIATQKNIKFMWIPSHVGIKGNKMADESVFNFLISFSIRQKFTK